MASYYRDTYDSSRSRQTRSNNDEGYLKPTAPRVGTSDSRRRVGETASEGQNRRDHYSQRSPNRSNRYSYDGYDTRYDYPPPLPLDTGLPTRERSRIRKRRSWPPRPTCEDEVTSLKKEAGSRRLLAELRKDEIPSRGTIDQEPMVEDVPEFLNRDERRFVVREGGGATGQPTPPTSEDEKARRRARRRPSKLEMNFKNLNNSVPEILNKRTSSPYAFSKQPHTPKEEVLGTRFLSPDDITSPPPTESNRRRRMTGSKSQPASPRRDSARYSMNSRPETDYFSLASESAIDEDDFYEAKLRPREKPATYPPSRDVPNSSPQTSVVDFAPAAPPPSSIPIRRRNLDARRNTDTETTLPTLQRVNGDKARRPTPLAATAALGGLGVAAASSLSADEQSRPRSRDSSYGHPRGPSPAGSAVSATEAQAMQRSRMSAEFSRDDDYHEPLTRTSSVSSSRPQSPSPRTPGDPPRIPKSDLDWSTLLAANASRRAKAPSCLSMEVQQEALPRQRGHMRQSSATTRVDSLPYPVDDGPMSPSVWMPSERSHQYFPESRPGTQMPMMQEPKSFLRSAEPAPSSSSYSSASTTRAPTRPSFPTRHSTAELPQTQTTKKSQPDRPRANESRRTSQLVSSQTQKDIQALLKKPLPSCARLKPVRSYSDWYTLVGAPSLDFCPDCVADVFDRTLYRNSFRRSPPRNLDTPVQCALGGMPWIRLAWLFTLQQQRTDLRLLEDLAEVEETSTPCPGDKLGSRTWYGLRDADGYFVKDFRICYSDVRKIESLLPTLSGMFVRLPQRNADEQHLCAIRPEGNRFSIYIDALISTHEKALAARSTPNPGPFISLVRWRAQLQECTKDMLIKKGLWHYMPGLEEFTICEDCFATIVEPEIERSSDLATRFHRTIQPVYGEGIGVSCQLYSPRMRKVFKRAVQEKDLKYLTRKARERREAELRLQERYRVLVEKAKRVSWGSVEEGRLERERTRIMEEWRDEWE
ncbi:uncharacterized protein LTR77_000171 [Saxophila tyrrhenica]|uniref:Uncharacterized protein n=1 Tax=Saxophila tyrrhenica TaxID=1690608 RepID=A0AAV9PNC7_9PEZI|nr:hypothetical protein LTR77_000171 [Saxophila tyrrhenica]